MDSLINLSYQTMGIEVVENNEAMLHVFPNPVTSVVNISYELDQPSPVELVIYNHLGQTLINLAEETKPAGS